MKITHAQLAQVPYLNLEHLGGRVVQLMPLFDGERWKMWFPAPNDLMVSLAIVEHGRGDYVAKAAANESDLQVRFLDVVWQHLSYRRVANATMAISEDIGNLATALAKIDFFWEQRAAIGRHVTEFVRTEIEYILVVARSLLDHVHEVMVGIWDNIQLLDTAQQERKAGTKLPAKLSKVCFQGRAVRSGEDLSATYALPASVAAFYGATGDFLREIRDARDGIVHNGKSAGIVFLTERGFGIERNGALARILGDRWADVHQINENVLSLRPLLAHLALGSICACDAATNSFAQCIAFLPPVAPGYRVYTRIAHAPALAAAQRVLDGGEASWVD